MKTKQFSSLGLDINFSVPESVEEFDTNAKRPGACLDEATNNVVYRGSLADFRDSFCEKLGEQTGVERKTKVVRQKTNEDGSKEDVLAFDESEADYVKRVVAQVGGEVSQFQSLADSVAAAIAFDASARERKPRAPTKLAKKYLDTASAILQSGNTAKAEAQFAQYGITWPTLSGDSAKDTDALARGIKAVQEAKEKSALDSLVA